MVQYRGAVRGSTQGHPRSSPDGNKGTGP
jgi:hypothetical protein